MAKFCTKCGAELKEGEVHVCPANQQINAVEQANQQQNVQQTNIPQENISQDNMSQMPNMQTQYTQSQNMNQGQYQQAPMQGYGNQYQQQQQVAKEAAQNVFNEFVSLLKKPLAKGKCMVEQCDFTNALILIIIQGIISGLFSVALLSKGKDVISLVAGFAGSYGNVLGDALKLPMFRGFFVTLVLSVALNFLLALFMFVINNICKVNLNFKQSVCMVAGKAVVTSVSILVALVIFELHIGAGLFMYYFVGIWGFLVVVLLESTFVDGEKREFLALYSSIVLLLFIIVAVFIFSKVWTLYLPDSIRTIMDDPGEMIQDLLKEVM